MEANEFFSPLFSLSLSLLGEGELPPLWIHDFLFSFIISYSPHFPRRAPSSWLFGVWALACCVRSCLWIFRGGPEVGLQAEGSARAMLFFRLCLGRAFPSDFSASDRQLFAFCFGVVLINEGRSFVFSTSDDCISIYLVFLLGVLTICR